MSGVLESISCRDASRTNVLSQILPGPKDCSLPPGLPISPRPNGNLIPRFPVSAVYPTLRMAHIYVASDSVSRMGFVPYVYDPKIRDYWLGIAIGKAWGNLTTIGGVYEADKDKNLLDTLYREVKEETGGFFQLPKPEQIGSYPVIYHKNTYTVLVEYPYASMQYSMKSTDEINTVVWFTRRQLYHIHATCRRVSNLRLSFSSYLEPIVLPLTCGLDLTSTSINFPPPRDYLESRPRPTKEFSENYGDLEDLLLDANKYRWYHIDVVISDHFSWIANGATRKYQVRTTDLPMAVDAVKKVNNRAIKVYCEGELPGSQSLEIEIRRWRKNDELADEYHDEYTSAIAEEKIDVIIKYEQLAYNSSRREKPTDMSRINGIKFIDAINRLLRAGVNQFAVLLTYPSIAMSPWLACLTESKIFTISNGVVSVPA